MELRDSKNCLVIYVPRKAQDNFTFSLEHGVWGFPRESAELETLKAGDFVLFGGGFTGGSLRVSVEDWPRHTITELTIVTASIKL